MRKPPDDGPEVTFEATRGRTSVPLFMIVERFRNGDAAAVYRRFRKHGRMTRDGLAYVASWTTEDLCTCYQLMETDDRSLIDEWMGHWSDLVEFEVHPVITSHEAAKRVAS